MTGWWVPSSSLTVSTIQSPQTARFRDDAEQGVSTETEASARDVAQIIQLIRQHGIPAIFFENVTDPRLLKRIAAETGARIGGTLYSDALTGPDGPAPTYVDLMRHNVDEIAAALK